MNWYVIYTKSRAEKKTRDLLQDAGHEVYLPLVKTMRQWSDRKKKVEIPLFSGYLFIRTVPEGFWKIRATDGVVNFVRFGESIAKVREQDIMNIRILLQESENLSVTNSVFRQGEEIEITDGKFKGYKGLVEFTKGKNNLIVSLLEIGMSVKLEIPAHFVKQISK
ncbi:MAG: UpxY family transcription antiterminator [Bacteroidales bacterium]|nr:UpxY family transcription antiterminator [Bacteroidales bacterium]